MIGEIEFYQDPPKNYRQLREIGHFFLAPVSFSLDGSQLPRLKLDYNDQEHPENSSYTVDVIDVKRFDPRTDKPIYRLGLSSDDLVLTIPHKTRPVIIISDATPDWKVYKGERRDYYWVAPVYSVKDQAGAYKFSEEFLLRTQAYEYPNLFYLPESNEHDVHESLVRFDRAFFTHESFLTPQPKQLSEEATMSVSKWFQFFAGAELDELLYTYRELALQELHESK